MRSPPRRGGGRQRTLCGMAKDLRGSCEGGLGRRANSSSQLREDLLGRLNGLLNVLLSVRQGHEAGLVLRGSKVDAPGQHRTVPPAELLSVAVSRVREASHRALAEEEAEHAADVAAADLMARRLASLQDAVDELVGHLAQLLVGARLLQLLHRLDAGGHGEGVAAQGARLVHGPSRRNHLHDLLLATVGTHRQATTDDLAHGRDVRSHAEVPLSTTVGDAEAGHDLVEDKEGTVLRGELTETLKELLRGRDEAGVADDGLKNHGRHLVHLQERLDGLQVVVLGAERAVRGTLRHTRRVRQAKRGNTGARLHEESVRVAVVAALELDDGVALGVGTHQADHAHARLRAAVAEAHHLDRRHRLNHHLRELVLQRAGRTEGGTLVHLLLQRVQHIVVRVAEDRRAPGADVVDVLVAIHVPGVRTLHLVEDHRVPAHGLEGADRAGDATRHKILGLSEDALRLLRVQSRCRRAARHLRGAALGGTHGHASDHGSHGRRGGTAGARRRGLRLRREHNMLRQQVRGRRRHGRGQEERLVGDRHFGIVYLVTEIH
mmetsp:Transcript_79148/g.171047  ORF Transcript_79148/g.171047 Transcript_79148/m.171047 type:complete len:549 (+) Transcript_79148:282-1928(+)